MTVVWLKRKLHCFSSINNFYERANVFYFFILCAELLMVYYNSKVDTEIVRETFTRLRHKKYVT